MSDDAPDDGQGQAHPPITGKVNLRLGPVVIGGNRPPHTYLGQATAFLQGLAILAQNGHAGPSTYLVAGFAAECALKAFLSRHGDDSGVRKNPLLRHDLEQLWTKCREEGLDLGDLPPWLTRLSDVHRAPYVGRYATGVHGTVYPPLDETVDGVRTVIRKVRSALSQPS